MIAILNSINGYVFVKAVRGLFLRAKLYFHSFLLLPLVRLELHSIRFVLCIPNIFSHSSQFYPEDGGWNSSEMLTSTCHIQEDSKIHIQNREYVSSRKWYIKEEHIRIISL
jgi:hypothetical protein